MKILFINMSDKIGGAAIAAFRLSEDLHNFYNSKNYFAVRNKVSNLPNVFQTRKNNFEITVEKYFNIASNLLGLQYQYLPFSPKRILTLANEIKPDVISLHNTLGGYFSTPLISKLSKVAPIVWTLHDMWAFTGNSAHTFGDDSWKQMKNSKSNIKNYPFIGINSGEFLLKQKKRIYQNSNLTFVTPSKWLYDLAVQSPVLNNKRIHKIFNGINLEKFSPQNKFLCRKEFGIEEDAKVIMFGAEKLSGNEYKGGRNLIEILRLLNKKTLSKIDLLILGEGSLNEISGLQNLKFHNLGYISNEEKIIKSYSASDLFIYPTMADNLPNALVESISCGTPAVTFNIGGCGEIIQNDISGFLIEPFELENFANKTLNYLFQNTNQNALSFSARKFAEENFSLKDMSDKYHKIFLEEIESFKLKQHL